MQIDMLVVEVAKNFVAPDVTLEAGFACTVEVIVSMPFATKYVLKYNVNTRRKGFETRNVCGRVIAGRSARRKQDRKVVFVAAFSMMDLYMPSEGSTHKATILTDRWYKPVEQRGIPQQQQTQHLRLLAGLDCACSISRTCQAPMYS